MDSWTRWSARFSWVSFARLAAFGLTHAALRWRCLGRGGGQLWPWEGLGIAAAVAVFVVGNSARFRTRGAGRRRPVTPPGVLRASLAVFVEGGSGFLPVALVPPVHEMNRRGNVEAFYGSRPVPRHRRRPSSPRRPSLLQPPFPQPRRLSFGCHRLNVLLAAAALGVPPCRGQRRARGAPQTTETTRRPATTWASAARGLDRGRWIVGRGRVRRHVYRLRRARRDRGAAGTVGRAIVFVGLAEGIAIYGLSSASSSAGLTEACERICPLPGSGGRPGPRLSARRGRRLAPRGGDPARSVGRWRRAAGGLVYSCLTEAAAVSSRRARAERPGAPAAVLPGWPRARARRRGHGRRRRREAARYSLRRTREP